MNRKEQLEYQVQVFKNGKRKKIQCRNSYERRVVHNKAKELEIPSRTIIDYNRFHINQNFVQSKCCYDCMSGEITFTPFSYVELGAKDIQKLHLGEIKILEPQKYNCIRPSVLSQIIKSLKNQIP
jgi:hypothetical protein